MFQIEHFGVQNNIVMKYSEIWWIIVISIDLDKTTLHSSSPSLFEKKEEISFHVDDIRWSASHMGWGYEEEGIKGGSNHNDSSTMID